MFEVQAFGEKVNAEAPDDSADNSSKDGGSGCGSSAGWGAAAAFGAIACLIKSKKKE